MESKVVMAKLQELGEFVRSASSTIEAPVVRKLTDALQGPGAGAGKSAAKPGAPRKAAPPAPRRAPARGGTPRPPGPPLPSPRRRRHARLPRSPAPAAPKPAAAESPPRLAAGGRPSSGPQARSGGPEGSGPRRRRSPSSPRLRRLPAAGPPARWLRPPPASGRASAGVRAGRRPPRRSEARPRGPCARVPVRPVPRPGNNPFSTGGSTGMARPQAPLSRRRAASRRRPGRSPSAGRRPGRPASPGPRRPAPHPPAPCRARRPRARVAVPPVPVRTPA